jgi:hypothetical protein
VRRPCVLWLTAGVLLTVALPASGQMRRIQNRVTPRAGSWEIAGGITWTGGISGPTAAAELTRNGGASGGYDLFSAEGNIKNGIGAGATLGVYVSRTLAFEGGLRFSQPRLTYRLTGDVEDAQSLSAEEKLTRYVFTGSVVLHLRDMVPGRRAIPFVSAGAGYIRDLHERNELIETGTEFHFTGGVKYWFGPQPKLGIRGEAGVSLSDGGFDFKDKSRTLTIASASIVYLF